MNLTIGTGTDDGTLAVNGKNVPVKGFATLLGGDAGMSVREITVEELTKQLIAPGADTSLNELKEIAAWIQEHPHEAAALNEKLNGLVKLVGTLPDGISSTTVVGYITEAISEIDLTNYATNAAVSQAIAAALVGYLTEANIASDEEVRTMLDQAFGNA